MGRPSDDRAVDPTGVRRRCGLRAPRADHRQLPLERGRRRAPGDLDGEDAPRALERFHGAAPRPPRRGRGPRDDQRRAGPGLRSGSAGGPLPREDPRQPLLPAPLPGDPPRRRAPPLRRRAAGVELGPFAGARPPGRRRRGRFHRRRDAPASGSDRSLLGDGRLHRRPLRSGHAGLPTGHRPAKGARTHPARALGSAGGSRVGRSLPRRRSGPAAGHLPLRPRPNPSGRPLAPRRGRDRRSTPQGGDLPARAPR